jgi:methylglyoxal synthase
VEVVAAEVAPMVAVVDPTVVVAPTAVVETPTENPAFDADAETLIRIAPVIRVPAADTTNTMRVLRITTLRSPKAKGFSSSTPMATGFFAAPITTTHANAPIPSCPAR